MSAVLARAGTVPDEEACPWCGGTHIVELFEMWDHGHEFMLDTCCPAALEEVSAGIAEDPAWGRDLLRRLGAEAHAGHRLHRVADDEVGGLLLDYRLQVRPVAFAAARAFVARHHAHCNPPVVMRYGYAILNAGLLLGVAMVGNPVARALCGRGILEVNRLCVRRDVARALARNACSMLYGRCAQEAERRGFSHIVTYTRADEDGGSLVAAGWIQESVVRGRGWHSARRARGNTNAWIDKVRWGRVLRPKLPRPPPVPVLAPLTSMSEWMTGARQGSPSALF